MLSFYIPEPENAIIHLVLKLLDTNSLLLTLLPEGTTYLLSKILQQNKN